MATDTPITIAPSKKMRPGTMVMVSWTKQYMAEVASLGVLQYTGEISAGEANRRLDEIAARMVRERRIVGAKNIGEPNGTKTETPKAERAEGQNQ